MQARLEMRSQSKAAGRLASGSSSTQRAAGAEDSVRTQGSASAEESRPTRASGRGHVLQEGPRRGLPVTPGAATFIFNHIFHGEYNARCALALTVWGPFHVCSENIAMEG